MREKWHAVLRTINERRVWNVDGTVNDTVTTVQPRTQIFFPALQHANMSSMWKLHKFSASTPS
jgi:hypothetical protein